MDMAAVQFWGVRGTLPVPGNKSIRYGGNTNCVTVAFGNKHLFIFDAGTGIKELSNTLVKQNRFPLKAKIFITHPHYDHINALPFFTPLFMKGNQFEILGTNQDDMDIQVLISTLMDKIYLPFTIKEFSAELIFHNLNEESFFIDDILVKTLLLNHPGRCLGYRLEYKDKIFCYITDNELPLRRSDRFSQYEEDRLVNFIKGANVLVMDATYMDDEYLKKIGWGHSCISRVIDVADKAKVKLLCLYHHDPDQSDEDIDNKLKYALSLLEMHQSETCCIAPCEGKQILL